MFSFVWYEYDKVFSVIDELNEGIRCYMIFGLIYELNIRIIIGICCWWGNLNFNLNLVVLCVLYYNVSVFKFCGGINGNLCVFEYLKFDCNLLW